MTKIKERSERDQEMRLHFSLPLFLIDSLSLKPRYTATLGEKQPQWSRAGEEWYPLRRAPNVGRQTPNDMRRVSML